MDQRGTGEMLRSTDRTTEGGRCRKVGVAEMDRWMDWGAGGRAYLKGKPFLPIFPPVLPPPAARLARLMQDLPCCEWPSLQARMVQVPAWQATSSVLGMDVQSCLQ